MHLNIKRYLPLLNGCFLTWPGVSDGYTGSRRLDPNMATLVGFPSALLCSLQLRNVLNCLNPPSENRKSIILLYLRLEVGRLVDKCAGS